MNASFLVEGGAHLWVDLSPLQEQMKVMRDALSRDQFNRLMARTFNETGKKSRTLIAREVVQDYSVTQAWVKSNIMRHTLSVGSEVTCTIPLSSHKGTIGGRFKATGGVKGRRIRAKVLKRQRSTLPLAMKNQGGNPPFISPRLNGVAFTRRTRERLPIVRVVGLGVPQMPLNQSADEVCSALLNHTGDRLEHNFIYMFGGK